MLRCDKWDPSWVWVQRPEVVLLPLKDNATFLSSFFPPESLTLHPINRHVYHPILGGGNTILCCFTIMLLGIVYAHIKPEVVG